MKLPSDTFIAPEKLHDYLLVLRPADDKSQYLALAGYTRKNWQDLERDLREQFLTQEATESEATKYGTIYEIRDLLRGPNGKSLPVRTIWMQETATSKVKFITLLPDKRSLS